MILMVLDGKFQKTYERGILVTFHKKKYFKIFFYILWTITKNPRIIHIYRILPSIEGILTMLPGAEYSITDLKSS